MTEQPANLYDEYYFEHGCGRPYERDDHWLNFFDKIAARIVSDAGPKTALDAGCAKGFLVEKLRERGVEAWGVDISEYAIHSAHENVRDYVWVGSVAEPFPRKYDLIVTIEVLEHLPRELSEKALVNLCQHTDDIIFSSTPLDFKEDTHFNVQPVEYWAELFARQGFYRDVDFDASFITPWAGRFVRKSFVPTRMVRDYERRFWPVWHQNADLRAQLIQEEHRIKALDREINSLRNEVAHLQSQVIEKEETIQKLRSHLNERDRLILGMQVQVRQWEEMQASAGFRFLHNVRALRLRLAPPNSLRARLMQGSINGLSLLRREGIGAFIRAFVRKLTGTKSSAKDVAEHNIQTYATWIVQHTLNDEQLSQQREQVEKFTYNPLISLITPVYNPPAEVLRATVESVLAQTYTKWELCLVDGNSDLPGVHTVLNEYARKDSRVRVQMLEHNLGISGNSNVALDMAQGEFVQFLDHDDVLAPNALFEAVKCLNEDRAIDIIYYDEDKLSENGQERHDPFFKPDWSPEMLISANYLMHALMRRSLVLEAGKLDPTTDGAQDWDLAFRVTEKTNAIVHIPQVLYHWRQISGSTASNFGAKSWVFDVQLRSVENHLLRTGLEKARATFASPGFLRVYWPTNGNKVSIIIPTKEKVEFLRKCISSITQKTTYPDYEIVLVDNGSVESETLKYYEILRKDSRIKFVDYQKPFNYSQANNVGAEHATGDIFLFLNNDIEILETDWLEEMVRWVDRPEIGIVGAKLLYPDMKIQHAGVIVGMEGHASHIFWGTDEKYGGPFGSVDWYRNYTAVTGACMMMRREVYDAIGGFDETYVLAFSDIEICVRAIQFGYRVVYTPYARLKHYEGKSRGSHIPANDVMVGKDHFFSLIEVGDPFYNPNLSYNHRVPMIAVPGEETRMARLQRISELFTRQP